MVMMVRNQKVTLMYVYPYVVNPPGPVHTSVSAFKVATDDRVIGTTQQLPTEFPFNLDQNSGSTIGIGLFSYSVVCGAE